MTRMSNPALGRRGSTGNKFRMSLGLPVEATLNCADNTAAASGGVAVAAPKGNLHQTQPHNRASRQCRVGVLCCCCYWWLLCHPSSHLRLDAWSFCYRRWSCCHCVWPWPAIPYPLVVLQLKWISQRMCLRLGIEMLGFHVSS